MMDRKPATDHRLNTVLKTDIVDLTMSDDDSDCDSKPMSNNNLLNASVLDALSKDIETIDIPSPFSSISGKCFQKFTNLKKITLPYTITSIKDQAFIRCKSLISLRLNNGIENIGDLAFYLCQSLESIQIPYRTQSVGEFAFYQCKSLKIVFISSETKQTGDIFRECNPNVIVLSDRKYALSEWYGYPLLSMDEVNTIANDLLPENIIPPHLQVAELDKLFKQVNPSIHIRAKNHGFNLLHLLAYFSGIDNVDFESIVEKFPQALHCPDNKGRLPLHHIIASTIHNIDPYCYGLVRNKTPDWVVHLSIESNSPAYEVRDIVVNKIDGLSKEDSVSGLLPFMMVAEENKPYNINLVYELLRMKPDVIHTCSDSMNNISMNNIDRISCENRMDGEDIDGCKRRRIV